MLQRLRKDFQLSIIVMMGMSAVVVVLPPVVYRFYVGATTLAVVGCLFIVTELSAVVYAWRTGNTRRGAVAMAIACAIGGVLVSVMQHDVGYLWVYPPLVASFVLIGPVAAILLNGTTITAVVTLSYAVLSAEQTLVFVATGIGVSVCACVFALRNEYQRKQLEQLVIFDALTGVRNRRAMDIALRNAITHAARTGVQYALVMMDLDHFKSVNDAYGHSVGDEVLVKCANLLQQKIRGADRLYRFGGEEFVIVLTGVSRTGMETVLADLRLQLALNLKCHGSPVTASFGGTLLRPDENADTWLTRADNALYHAKRAGRNCVVIDSDDDKDSGGDYVLLYRDVA